MTDNRYAELAKTAYANLTSTWFTPDNVRGWVGDDYWRTPTIICELIGYSTLTGNAAADVRKLIDTAYDAGKGYLEYCGWLDDLAAWGRMFVAAQRADDAEGVFAQLDGAWDETCGGGIWWKRDTTDPENFKASVSTLQYGSIGAGLHKPAAAERAWAWENSAGLVDEHNVIWGGMSSDCERDPGNPPAAADQGHALGMFLGLYRETQDTRWLTVACEVAAGTIATMSWPGTHVLATRIDAQFRSESEEWRQNNNDLTLSKGLFMSGLGDLAATLSKLGGKWQTAAEQQGAYLRANADTLAAQYPQGLYDINWLHGDPKYEGDEDWHISVSTQYSALAAFVAAAKNPG
jgi:hypothetical protein